MSTPFCIFSTQNVNKFLITYYLITPSWTLYLHHSLLTRNIVLPTHTATWPWLSALTSAFLTMTDCSRKFDTVLIVTLSSWVDFRASGWPPRANQGEPDWKVTHLQVAELDLPTPRATSVTHALGPPTSAALVVLHTLSIALPSVETENCHYWRSLHYVIFSDFPHFLLNPDYPIRPFHEHATSASDSAHCLLLLLPLLTHRILPYLTRWTLKLLQTLIFLLLMYLCYSYPK